MNAKRVSTCCCDDCTDAYGSCSFVTDLVGSLERAVDLLAIYIRVGRKFGEVVLLGGDEVIWEGGGV